MMLGVKVLTVEQKYTNRKWRKARKHMWVWLRIDSFYKSPDIFIFHKIYVNTYMYVHVHMDIHAHKHKLMYVCLSRSVC
jgi:hypothetical protein